MRYADTIDWSRAAVDSKTIRARRGGNKTGKRPPTRAEAALRTIL